MDGDLSNFLRRFGSGEKAAKAVQEAQNKVHEYLGKDIMICSVAVADNAEEAERFCCRATSLLTGLLIQGKINILKRKEK